ncbi:hypothetical protein CPB83DRAFT_902508 [Crepidotus variabilis]|uniref:Uncharacterized protein n=1 Tax=Crepidotus variabilis TaxID=179855 RepID=A0A9P6EPU8_9AGAR|nr:hypothetical protein CPB83DRAFT_902508 [Crepidotus variabilis]
MQVVNAILALTVWASASQLTRRTQTIVVTPTSPSVYCDPPIAAPSRAPSRAHTFYHLLPTTLSLQSSSTNSYFENGGFEYYQEWADLPPGDHIDIFLPGNKLPAPATTASLHSSILQDAHRAGTSCYLN